MVSSRWVDWKSFTVHSLAGASDYPRITTPEGDLIQCSGWIRGKWASYDLQAQWVITQIFVVDATFATSGDTSSDTSNFLLSPKVSSKINQLSGKRRVSFKVNLPIANETSGTFRVFIACRSA